MLDTSELVYGHLDIAPGQQTDFSDEFYTKRHQTGENLERRARKQEKDRLVQERNKLKHQVDQLKQEVASAAFYANASPVKNTGRMAPTPVVSQRVKDGERAKRKQLSDLEDTLRRYEELLEPRDAYGNTIAAKVWTTGGKGEHVVQYQCMLYPDSVFNTLLGVPPAPSGVSPDDFLQPTAQQSPPTQSAVSQKKTAASMAISNSQNRAPSRSASPTVSVSTSLNGSGPPNKGSLLRISIRPPKKPSDLVAATAQDSDTSAVYTDYKGSGSVFPSGKRRGRPPKSARPLAPAGPLPQSAPSPVISPATAKRRRKRRRRANESEDDDGAKEAIAMLNASKEFIGGDTSDTYEYMPYSAEPSGGQVGPVESDAEDDESMVYTSRKTSSRRERTRGKEAQWEYKGTPTVIDSFYRAGQPTEQTDAREVSQADAKASEPHAFGAALPTNISTEQEFSIEAVKALIKSRPPDLPLALHVRSEQRPAPLSSRPVRMTASANMSRSATPSTSAFSRYDKDGQRRRRPRVFRTRPSSAFENALDPLASVILHNGHRSMQQKVADAFDTDGELSSVSTVSDEDETRSLPDNDTRWRTERATRYLEPSDEALPAFLIPGNSLASLHTPIASPTLSKSTDLSARAENGVNPLFLSALDNTARSRKGTPRVSPEPSSVRETRGKGRAKEKEKEKEKEREKERERNIQNERDGFIDDGTVTSVGGIKTRKRIKLEEYPTNELVELHDDVMAMLRRSYEYVTGKKGASERTIPPLGEWQIKLDESFVRNT